MLKYKQTHEIFVIYYRMTYCCRIVYNNSMVQCFVPSQRNKCINLKYTFDFIPVIGRDLFSHIYHYSECRWKYHTVRFPPFQLYSYLFLPSFLGSLELSILNVLLASQIYIKARGNIKQHRVINLNRDKNNFHVV